MKKLVMMVALIFGYSINAQVKSNLDIQADINNTNAFLDGSTSFSRSSNDETTGKGLVFPDTDLTQFAFDLSYADGQTFPTYFNGMLVYNVGTGKTGSDLDSQGIQVDVEPGFYYFYNPNGEANQSVSEGKWVRIGGAAEAKRTTASGKEIFTQKGEFTLKTGDNGTSILFPEGMTSLYSIKIYRKDGDASHLVGSSLYTYKLNAGEGQKNIIFGTGIISTAYPAGTYEYEMEYIQ